jgi:hypothetical protein
VRSFKSEIARIVDGIEQRPHYSDNPVSDYLDREHAVVSTYVQRDNINKLSALATEISGNIVDLSSDAKYISYGCLELLLQSRYIDPGPDVLRLAYELWHLLKNIDAGERAVEVRQAALLKLQNLELATRSIQERISRSEFEEPPMPSSMLWTTDEHRGYSLLISGPPATGKSCIALSLAQSIVGSVDHHTVRGIEQLSYKSMILRQPEEISVVTSLSKVLPLESAGGGDGQGVGFEKTQVQPGSSIRRRLTRNETCYCASGRKYKKCHGMGGKSRI